MGAIGFHHGSEAGAVSWVISDSLHLDQWYTPHSKSLLALALIVRTKITACIRHSDILCVLCCLCMVIGWEWLCCVCFSYHAFRLFGYVCVWALVRMLWGIYCTQDTVNSPNSSLNTFNLCHNLSWLKSFLFDTSTVFFMMLGVALEHEINVLEESYCINVLSGHFTLQNAPQM